VRCHGRLGEYGGGWCDMVDRTNIRDLGSDADFFVQFDTPAPRDWVRDRAPKSAI
jgi:hypothetical protein